MPPFSLSEAMAKIGAKTPIGSVLRSSEWEAVPLALRERAQFSATVESARVLQSVQDRLADELRLARETLAGGREAIFDRSSFIDRLRDIARGEGLTPVNEAIRGTIQDITSIPRLGLIYDMQKSQAQEFARWKLDQEEGALDLYPAQRLIRIEPRMKVRDWRARWGETATAVGYEGVYSGGDMVALKTSPIWETLSRFGTPWPPFDYGSGMGLEDVSRQEAIRMALITEDEDLQPATARFNDALEASVTNLSPELQAKLTDAFGDQVEISDGRAKWRAA